MPNAACPLCGRPVVIAPTNYGNRFVSLLYVPATRQEKIAACAVHGRPPFNRQTLAAGVEPESDGRDVESFDERE